MRNYLLTLFIALLTIVQINANDFQRMEKPQPLQTLTTLDPRPATPPPSQTKAHAFDTHGNHWALVEKADATTKLYVLPAQSNNQWIQDHASALPEDQWTWIIADWSGLVWVANQTRILHLDPRKPEQGWHDHSTQPNFPSGEITAMTISPNGGPCISFKHGCILDLDTMQINAAPEGITALTIDDTGTLWAHSENELYSKSAAPTAWQTNWKECARLPAGSHDLSGEVYKNEFYMDWAITADYGYPKTPTIFTKMLRFNPVRNQWSIAADYGHPRGYCGVGVLDDEIWTVGGTSINDKGEHFYSRITQIFNPATDLMRNGPDMPTQLASTLALNSGGRLYITGYSDGPDSQMQLYSIGSGEAKWTTEPLGPIGFGSVYGTELDGKLYLLSNHRYLAIYDTEQKSWSTSVVPNSPRSAALTHYKGEIWVMGGRNEEGETRSYIYTPKTQLWRRGPDLPRRIVWAAAFNIDGKLYLAGGCGVEAPGCYSNRTFQLRENEVK